ncbi:hypothetical protein B0I37DRAFT_366840 [Chaetomium sp. MPI-CAGE-AT-0009]|nr:hypothetical protein B0I37DRAFT_366840 [Chaetomium sp. MPI-CAGE-AT-0009]
MGGPEYPGMDMDANEQIIERLRPRHDCPPIDSLTAGDHDIIGKRYSRQFDTVWYSRLDLKYGMWGAGFALISNFQQHHITGGATTYTLPYQQ